MFIGYRLGSSTLIFLVPFQSFNSRTCQVVLGAGAMRSAGLKNITAKHLGRYIALHIPTDTADL